MSKGCGVLLHRLPFPFCAPQRQDGFGNRDSTYTPATPGKSQTKLVVWGSPDSDGCTTTVLFPVDIGTVRTLLSVCRVSVWRWIFCSRVEGFPRCV